jgi:H+/Cl- antiporter ClcA
MSIRSVVRRHRPFWAVLGLFAGLTLLAGLCLLAWSHYQDMETIASQLEATRPWLAVWRLTVFLVLIGGWPYWMAWLGRGRGWSEARRKALRAQRWRIALWLIVLELVLVQNVVGRFIQSLSGATP